MIPRIWKSRAAIAAVFTISLTLPSFAQTPAAKNACRNVPTHAHLKAALKRGLSSSRNGGLNNNMWGTVVNRDGIVCAVAFTGVDRGEQWPGSRVVSAQKANTANAFSLPAGVRRGCVKKARERHAVREMKVGPSEPACRSRLQTAVSCFSQKLRW